MPKLDHGTGFHLKNRTYRAQTKRDDEKEEGADAPPHVFERRADDGKAQPAEHHEHIGKHQKKCFLKFRLGDDAHDDQRERRGDHPVYVSRPEDEAPISCHKNTIATGHGKVGEAADGGAKEGNHKHEAAALFFRIQLIIKEQKRRQRHSCSGDKQKVLVRIVEILHSE